MSILSLLESRVLTTAKDFERESGRQSYATVQEVAKLVWESLVDADLPPSKAVIGGSRLTNLIDRVYLRCNDTDLKIIYYLNSDESRSNIETQANIISDKVRAIATSINLKIKKFFYLYKSNSHVLCGFEVQGAERSSPLQVIVHVLSTREDGRYPELYTTNMDSLSYQLYPVASKQICSDEGPVEEVIDNIKKRVITSQVIKIVDPERWLRYLLLLTEGCVDPDGDLNDKFYSADSLSIGVEELSNLFSFIQRKRKGVKFYDLYILINTLFHSPNLEERFICMRHFTDRLSKLSDGALLPSWTADIITFIDDCSLEEFQFFIKHFFLLYADNRISKTHRGALHEQCQFDELYVLLPHIDQEDIYIAKGYLKKTLSSCPEFLGVEKAGQFLVHIVPEEEIKEKIQLSLQNKNYSLAITQLLLSKSLFSEMLDVLVRHAKIEMLSRREQKSLCRNALLMNNLQPDFQEEVESLRLEAQRKRFNALEAFPRITRDIEYIADYLEGEWEEKIEVYIENKEYPQAINLLLFSNDLTINELEYVVLHCSLELLSNKEREYLVSHLDHLIPLFRDQLESFSEDRHSFINLLNKIISLPSLDSKAKNIASCGVLRKVISVYARRIPPFFWDQSLGLLELVKKENLPLKPWKRLLVDSVYQLKDQEVMPSYSRFLDSLDELTKPIEYSQIYDDHKQEFLYYLNFYCQTRNPVILDKLLEQPITEDKVSLFIEHIQPDLAWFNESLLYFTQRYQKAKLLNLIRYQLTSSPFESFVSCLSLLKSCSHEQKGDILPEAIRILEIVLEEKRCSQWEIYGLVYSIERLAQVVERKYFLLVEDNLMPAPISAVQCVIERMKSYSEAEDPVSLCKLARSLEKDLPQHLCPLLENCFTSKEKQKQIAETLITCFSQDINDIVMASLSWKELSLTHLLVSQLLSVDEDPFDRGVCEALLEHLKDSLSGPMVNKLGEDVLIHLADYYIRCSRSDKLKLDFLFKLFSIWQSERVINLTHLTLKCIEDFPLAVEKIEISDEFTRKITKLLLAQKRSHDAAIFFFSKLQNIDGSFDIVRDLFALGDEGVTALIIDRIKEQMRNGVNELSWASLLLKKELRELLLIDSEIYLLFLSSFKKLDQRTKKLKETILFISSQEVYSEENVLLSQVDLLNELKPSKSDWEVLLNPFLAKIMDASFQRTISLIEEPLPVIGQIILDHLLSVRNLEEVLVESESTSLLLFLLAKGGLIQDFQEKKVKVAKAIKSFINNRIEVNSPRIRVSDEQVAALVPNLKYLVDQIEDFSCFELVMNEVVLRINTIEVQDSLMDLMTKSFASKRGVSSCLNRDNVFPVIDYFLQNIIFGIKQEGRDRGLLLKTLFCFLSSSHSIGLKYLLAKYWTEISGSLVHAHSRGSRTELEGLSSFFLINLIDCLEESGHMDHEAIKKINWQVKTIHLPRIRLFISNQLVFRESSSTGISVDDFTDECKILLKISQLYPSAENQEMLSSFKDCLSRRIEDPCVCKLAENLSSLLKTSLPFYGP